MLLEVFAAVLLAALVLWLVLQPLYTEGRAEPAFEEPEDPEETRRGIALIALKEIDFDRATGKLSDADYDYLKTRYTQEALEAIREEDGADGPPSYPADSVGPSPAPGADTGPGHVCPRCGPRPEADARFCSQCGTALEAVTACGSCGASIPAGSHFCSECGTRVAA